MTRAKWYALILLVVAILAGTTYFSNQKKANLQNERALILELNQLRSAILLYKRAHNSNPKTLTEALESKTELGSKVQWSAKKGKNDQWLDPFGNPYLYNSGKAWVHSTSKGYESW